MERQNFMFAAGISGLFLLVSTSAFAAYYGTDAYVRGSGSCSSGVSQCSPGDLPYGYDSSNPASNYGVSSTSSSGPAVNSNSGSQASGTGNTTGGFVNGSSSSTAGINSLHASAAVNVANIIPDTIAG